MSRSTQPIIKKHNDLDADDAHDHSKFDAKMAMAMVVSLVFVLIILLVLNSSYMQIYSYPVIYFFAGLLFFMAKVEMLLRACSCNKIIPLVIIGLLGIGAALITSSDVETARWGVWLLIAGHIADFAAVAYMKWGQKKEVPMIALAGSMIADVVIVGLLAYSLMS